MCRLPFDEAPRSCQSSNAHPYYRNSRRAAPAGGGLPAPSITAPALSLVIPGKRNPIDKIQQFANLTFTMRDHGQPARAGRKRSMPMNEAFHQNSGAERGGDG